MGPLLPPWCVDGAPRLRAPAPCVLSALPFDTFWCRALGGGIPESGATASPRKRSGGGSVVFSILLR